MGTLRTGRLKGAALWVFLLGGAWLSACGLDPGPVPTVLSDITVVLSGRETLLVRLAHVTDTHVTDVASPGRLTQFDGLFPDAWRPQEAYAAQILDGLIRSVNRYHREVGPVDLLIHTGDAVDNAQTNELRWFLQVMDGQEVTPRSGDDEVRWSPSHLNPFETFQAEGVYAQGRHGPEPTVPWVALMGNHDAYAAGNFPIVMLPGGRRIAPLPLFWRPGVVLPVALIPDGQWTHDDSPYDAQPASLFGGLVPITKDADRAFYSRRECLEDHFASPSAPQGHGFADPNEQRAWHSRSITESVRLIALDTADVPSPLPSMAYAQGAISERQLRWLRAQLADASQQGQWVVVASHHPSGALQKSYGSAIGPAGLRTLLNEHDNVILHLAGHTHRNRVVNWGGYVEVETGSALEYPQTGRIIEIYQSELGDSLLINYATISPRGGDDALAELREVAFELARDDAGRAAAESAEQMAETRPTSTSAMQWLAGSPTDREGCLRLDKTSLR